LPVSHMGKLTCPLGRFLPREAPDRRRRPTRDLRIPAMGTPALRIRPQITEPAFADPFPQCPGNSGSKTEVIGNGTHVDLDPDEIEETVKDALKKVVKKIIKDAVEDAVDLNGNGHRRSIQ
jgi:hypothetical protein